MFQPVDNSPQRHSMSHPMENNQDPFLPVMENTHQILTKSGENQQVQMFTPVLNSQPQMAQPMGTSQQQIFQPIVNTQMHAPQLFAQDPFLQQTESPQQNTAQPVGNYQEQMFQPIYNHHQSPIGNQQIYNPQTVNTLQHQMFPPVGHISEQIPHSLNNSDHPFAQSLGSPEQMHQSLNNSDVPLAQSLGSPEQIPQSINSSDVPLTQSLGGPEQIPQSINSPDVPLTQSLGSPQLFQPIKNQQGHMFQPPVYTQQEMVHPMGNQQLFIPEHMENPQQIGVEQNSPGQTIQNMNSPNQPFSQSVGMSQPNESFPQSTDIPNAPFSQTVTVNSQSDPFVQPVGILNDPFSHSMRNQPEIFQPSAMPQQQMIPPVENPQEHMMQPMMIPQKEVDQPIVNQELQIPQSIENSDNHSVHSVGSLNESLSSLNSSVQEPLQNSMDNVSCKDKTEQHSTQQVDKQIIENVQSSPPRENFHQEATGPQNPHAVENQQKGIVESSKQKIPQGISNDNPNEPFSVFVSNSQDQVFQSSANQLEQIFQPTEPSKQKLVPTTDCSINQTVLPAHREVIQEPMMQPTEVSQPQEQVIQGFMKLNTGQEPISGNIEIHTPQPVGPSQGMDQSKGNVQMQVPQTMESSPGQNNQSVGSLSEQTVSSINSSVHETVPSSTDNVSVKENTPLTQTSHHKQYQQYPSNQVSKDNYDDRDRHHKDEYDGQGGFNQTNAIDNVSVPNSTGQYPSNQQNRPLTQTSQHKQDQQYPSNQVSKDSYDGHHSEYDDRDRHHKDEYHGQGGFNQTNAIDNVSVPNSTGQYPSNQQNTPLTQTSQHKQDQQYPSNQVSKDSYDDRDRHHKDEYHGQGGFNQTNAIDNVSVPNSTGQYPSNQQNTPLTQTSQHKQDQQYPSNQVSKDSYDGHHSKYDDRDRHHKDEYHGQGGFNQTNAIDNVSVPNSTGQYPSNQQNTPLTQTSQHKQDQQYPSNQVSKDSYDDRDRHHKDEYHGQGGINKTNAIDNVSVPNSTGQYPSTQNPSNEPTHISQHSLETSEGARSQEHNNAHPSSHEQRTDRYDNYERRSRYDDRDKHHRDGYHDRGDSRSRDRSGRDHSYDRGDMYDRGRRDQSHDRSYDRGRRDQSYDRNDTYDRHRRDHSHDRGDGYDRGRRDHPDYGYGRNRRDRSYDRGDYQRGSYQGYDNQRYDPRYDPYRDRSFDDRYDPQRAAYYADPYYRPRSRQGYPERPSSRQGDPNVKQGNPEQQRPSSRQGDPYQRQGNPEQQRPSSRQGDPYQRQDRSYQDDYDDYDGRRERYRRGYEEEMKAYQYGQYANQYDYNNQYNAQTQYNPQAKYSAPQGYYDYYGNYYSRTASYDSNYDSRSHHSQSRGSTPSFGQSTADQFARDLNNSRPGSRQSGYEQSPIYPHGDASRHGYYMDSYDQSYIGQMPAHTEVARRTPPRYTLPHVKASLTAGGIIVELQPNRPQDGQPATVILREPVEGLAGSCAEFRAFPGPLVRSDTHKKDVLSYCQKKVGELNTVTGMIDRESAQLLWKYLEILIKQNGVVVGADLAEILMDGRESFTQQTPPVATNALPMVKANESGSPSGSLQGQGIVTTDRTVVSPKSEGALDRFRELCLFGRKKEALEYAMNSGQWDQAICLSTKMGQTVVSKVTTRFANNALSINDPLRTLYQLMSGRQPSVCTTVNDQSFKDWRPHLAMILSQGTERTDLDTRSIISMGDCFASKGYLFSSQFCYLAAGCPFQAATNKTAKLVLLGSKHTLPLDEHATISSMQMTEVFEYGMSLAKENFSIPTFQPYKFLYATKMLDVGLAEETLNYMEVLSKTIVMNPTAYNKCLIQSVADLGDRLKDYDPQRMHTLDNIQDPVWLHNIQTVVKQFESGMLQQAAVQPTSGTQTPVTGGTRSSSELGDLTYGNDSSGGISFKVSHHEEPMATTELPQQMINLTLDNSASQQQQFEQHQQQQQQQGLNPAQQHQIPVWDANTQQWIYTPAETSQQTANNQYVNQQQQQAVQQGLDPAQQHQIPVWDANTQQWIYTPAENPNTSVSQQFGQETVPNTQQQQQQQLQDPLPQQPQTQDPIHPKMDPEGHDYSTQGFDTNQQSSTSASYTNISVPVNTNRQYDDKAQSKPPMMNGFTNTLSSETDTSDCDSAGDTSVSSASTVNDMTQSTTTPKYYTPPQIEQSIHQQQVYSRNNTSTVSNVASNHGNLPSSSMHTPYNNRVQQLPSTNVLPDIQEVSPTWTGSDSSTPKASPGGGGMSPRDRRDIFNFGSPPPPSPLYRASDPSTPLGGSPPATNQDDTADDADKPKKKAYWPGDDDEDMKKIGDAGSAKKGSKQGDGGGWLKFGWPFKKNKSNEMKLPDDNKKSIIYDKEKKQWIDLNADPADQQTTTSAPPPTDADFMRKMSMPAVIGNKDATDGTGAPPAAGGLTPNRFSRGKLRGSGARTQYVDVLASKAKPAATAPSTLLPMLPKSHSVPANIFIPSVAETALDHHDATQPPATNGQTDAVNGDGDSQDAQTPAYEAPQAAGPPPPVAEEPVAAPTPPQMQFFNPSNFQAYQPPQPTSAPQQGTGGSRLSRYGGSRRPQYPR